MGNAADDASEVAVESLARLVWRIPDHASVFEKKYGPDEFGLKDKQGDDWSEPGMGFSTASLGITWKRGVLSLYS